ncbi:hypothetical protein PHYPSEUDO_015379 [Phytophthora pseudosyringae]|uniref:ABC transmembrane type-1 domain-containing protein n=1 Tax=Phytophthora pseudosyringae TaxID=221518 RepID=A0A8T1W3W4_9STRA|nr:hypothetical protein PHYPSEUDO_015379 [Phytophthora pseudosyringae]
MMAPSHNAIDDVNTPKLNDGNVKDAGRLIENEEREEGRVSAAVFWRYFQSMGGLKVLLLLLVIQTLRQGCQFNMTVYALLGGGSALMVLARALTLAIAGFRAARDLFRLLTHGLLSVPLRFFDIHPIGRIVNRFGACDGDLHREHTDCVCSSPRVPVRRFAKFYLMPFREISRLLKVASSPVLSHISRVEEGVTTIRVFGPQYVEQTVAENFSRNDVNARAWFCDFVVATWFQIRMELIGSGVMSALPTRLHLASTRLVVAGNRDGPDHGARLGQQLGPFRSKTSSSATNKEVFQY